MTPVPSTLKALRAEAAASWVSPSEVTSPWQVLAAVIGASASVTPFDAGEGADLGQDRRPRERGDHPVGAADVDDLGPGGGELIGAAGGVEPGAEADVDEDLVCRCGRGCRAPPRQAEARGLHPLRAQCGSRA